MTSLLAPQDLSSALQLRDLSDPSHGPHAMQLLLDEVLHAPSSALGDARSTCSGADPW